MALKENKISSQPFEVVIEPNRKWLQINWKEILHYSDLLFLLVRRDFVSKYKQTVLGPLWYVIQPLLTTLVFVVIFNRVAKISTDNIPPILFYLCGLMVWTYFMNCMTKISMTFIDNSNIFGKVYFPRLIIPIADVVAHLISFGIQFLTFLVVYMFFLFFKPIQFHPNKYLFLLPFLLLQTAALALGIGLFLSSLTAKYRDFTHLTKFITQIWMYATPIIYPLSIIPNKWRILIVLNPMTSVIELVRYGFFSTISINIPEIIISGVFTIFALIVGVLFFYKTERTFIDTI